MWSGAGISTDGNRATHSPSGAKVHSRIIANPDIKCKLEGGIVPKELPPTLSAASRKLPSSRRNGSAVRNARLRHWRDLGASQQRMWSLLSLKPRSVPTIYDGESNEEHHELCPAK